MAERHIEVHFEARHADDGRWFFFLPESPEVIVAAFSPEAFNEWLAKLLERASEMHLVSSKATLTRNEK